VANFTAVNFEYGYKSGELVLKQVDVCLKQVTRKRDVIGRDGSDMFIVCLLNI
jgi:diguanylate cyclase (GGDEF)-like protein